MKRKSNDSTGLGDAYHTDDASPFDVGGSMQALLEQGQALYAAFGAYNAQVKWYCEQGLHQFNAYPIVAPVPPTAVAHHARNMASGLALPTIVEPAQAQRITVASNYSVSLDHTRHCIMVRVDVSGRASARDSDAKDGSAKYHLSRRPKGKRTIRVDGSNLAFTLSVGRNTVVHPDAQTYKAINAHLETAPIEPRFNHGVYTDGEYLTVYAFYDERLVSVRTLDNGTRVYARSTSVSNPSRYTVHLEDGLWFTFYMFVPA